MQTNTSTGSVTLRLREARNALWKRAIETKREPKREDKKDLALGSRYSAGRASGGDKTRTEDAKRAQNCSCRVQTLLRLFDIDRGA